MTKLNDLFSKINKKQETDDENIDNLFSLNNSVSSKNIKSSHLSINSVSKDDDENVISFINDLFLKALQKKASDIHLEPTNENIRIRFRIDGEFLNYKTLDLKKLDSLIARIKIMAYLRIDEHRLPQDGKINFNLFAGKSIDLRVSVMPTIYGEKVVIRVLKKEEKPQELSALGMFPYNMVKIKKHLNDSNGIILAVGPTGSGKSTTLFSLLSQFDAEQNNITTLEDPVEYRIPGVNHIQINPSIGFNFSDGLRALLRQDPDIIMVGEIRDSETAKLAIEASITGHLVFSTLHTNSASHTIGRLLNLGIDPLLLSSSLKMIISQRLVRKLCPHCKESYQAPENIKNTMIGKIGKYMKNKDEVTIYRAKEGGCEYCNNTGYSGRVGIYEVLEMTEKMENLLLKNASRNQIEIQAIGDGMVTIGEDAFLKVLMGETSIEEVLGILGI